MPNRKPHSYCANSFGYLPDLIALELVKSRIFVSRDSDAISCFARHHKQDARAGTFGEKVIYETSEYLRGGPTRRYGFDDTSEVLEWSTALRPVSTFR